MFIGLCLLMSLYAKSCRVPDGSSSTSRFLLLTMDTSPSSNLYNHSCVAVTTRCFKVRFEIWLFAFRYPPYWLRISYTSSEPCIICSISVSMDILYVFSTMALKEFSLRLYSRAVDTPIMFTFDM